MPTCMRALFNGHCRLSVRTFPLLLPAATHLSRRCPQNSTARGRCTAGFASGAVAAWLPSSRGVSTEPTIMPGTSSLFPSPPVPLSGFPALAHSAQTSAVHGFRRTARSAAADTSARCPQALHATTSTVSCCACVQALLPSCSSALLAPALSPLASSGDSGRRFSCGSRRKALSRSAIGDKEAREDKGPSRESKTKVSRTAHCLCVERTAAASLQLSV